MLGSRPLVRTASACLLRALALGSLLGVPGCAGDQTSLLVTVTFDDATRHPTGLSVTVAMLRRSITIPVATPGNRALKSGDSFAILLGDDTDGQSANLQVTTTGEAGVPLSGQSVATIRKHVEVPLTIALGAASPADGGVDLVSTGDGAVDDGAVDAAAKDAAAMDAAAVDAAPDLATLCVPGCLNNTEVVCGDGGIASRTCAFGCSGNGRCARPDNCASLSDISSAGTFTDSLAGFFDDDKGSCGGAGGVDAVAQLTTDDWRTVEIDTLGSSFDTLLYSRLACADGTTELPMAGPCAQSLTTLTGTACNDDHGGAPTSQLVLCNLPPGIPIYTWLDSKVQNAGAYTLNVKLSAPASLNSCAEAGNLLDGKNRTFTVDTAKKTNAFKSNGGCGDNGATSPDAIFFLAVTQPRTFTITTQAAFKHITYFRPACAGQDLTCAASQNSNGMQSATATAPLPAGFYFVIVDGVGGGSGSITFTVK